MSRVVPWMCRKEWLVTYQNLYSFHDKASQVQGAKRVEAWRSKGNGQLPVSIEATVSLIAAILDDTEDTSKSSLGVQLAMAMAIVRFVNGMVDVEQKGVYARSVQSIADDIGLPDWLVDLRHEATHAALPSLQVLRTGCKFSLEWLDQHYWRAQIIEIKERDAKLTELLQKYVEEREKEFILQGKKKKMLRTKDRVKEIVSITLQYDTWDFVLEVLVGKPGHFFPTGPTLNKFISSIEATNAGEMNVPEEAVFLWKPLFKALNQENSVFLSRLMAGLIQKLCESQSGPENSFLVKYIACWIRFLLLNATGDEGTWKMDLDCRSVLEACLRYRSSYTPVFLPLIVGACEILPPETISKLKKLCDMKVVGSYNFVDKETKNVSVYRFLGAHYENLAEFFKYKSNNREPGWQLYEISGSVSLGALIGCDPLEFEKLSREKFDGKVTRTIMTDGCFDDGGDTRLCEVPDNNFVNEDDFSAATNPVEMECDNDDQSKTLVPTVIKTITERIFIF